MTFLDRINQNYFNNGLSAEVLLLLGPVNNERVEVQNWVERMSRQMKNQRFRAQDFNELKAWVVGSIVTKLLPGSWRGFVPPITLQGRHVSIDDYMESNQWKQLKAGDNFLDLGCGFPPLTTVDTAKRFPGVLMKGADPSFGRYLVKDIYGDYACFDNKAELLYFQPGSNEPDRWNKLFNDAEATREYFLNHLIPVMSLLPGKEGVLGTAEHEGFTVIENPVLEYARPNLIFDQRGIGSPGFSRYQMVRCFNVLCYFNRAFREETLSWISEVLEEGGIFLTGMDWTRSRHARYTVYRKEKANLIPKEFAFSVENIRPLEIVAWFALHDDDYDTAALAKLVGIIRDNDVFCNAIDQRMDELLVRAGFKPRTEQGYLGGLNETADPMTLDTVADRLGGALEREG